MTPAGCNIAALPSASADPSMPERVLARVRESRNARWQFRAVGRSTEWSKFESIGGAAADLILVQAKEWPADLIVMGTHGRRGLLRVALGSDAEQVVRSAAVPVLLVRCTAPQSKRVPKVVPVAASAT